MRTNIAVILILSVLLADQVRADEKEAIRALEAFRVKLTLERGVVVAVDYAFLRQFLKDGDHLLEPLQHLKSVRRLRITGADFSGAALVNIAGMTSLEKLELDCCLYDDAMPHLAALVNLLDLDLGPTKITTLGLPHLRKLTKLQKLRVSVMRGENFDLRTLTSLRDLDVHGTAFSDRDMEQLAKFTDLEKLDLSKTMITDAGLRHLAELKKLKTLKLNSTRITDAGLKHLHNLKELRTLEVAEVRVTDEGLMKLEKSIPRLMIQDSESGTGTWRPSKMKR